MTSCDYVIFACNQTLVFTSDELQFLFLIQFLIFLVYDKGEGFGCSTYRLRAKNGEYVFLRTCGYLEFDQNTQRIDSFICVNTLIR